MHRAFGSYVYGLSYLMGAVLLYVQLRSRGSAVRTGMTVKQAGDYVAYLMIGVLVGGRLGFVIADSLTPQIAGGRGIDFYLQQPIEFLAVWHGGMSFHGGLVGAIVAGYAYAKRLSLSVWAVADDSVVWAPIPMATARIATSWLGELPGRAMRSLFATRSAPIAFSRFPWHYVEATCMVCVVLPLLWYLRRRALPSGLVFWTFLAVYGCLRFFVEFLREPGIVAWGLTAAQWLSLIMVVVGAAMIVVTTRDASLKRSGRPRSRPQNR